MEINRPVSNQPMPENAKRVFKGVVFDVYQWEQEGYDGNVHIFEKLKRYDTAIVIPITEDGKIILSKEEQPGKAPFIGTIGGRIDEGEEPLEAAKRELLEETGYEAKEWIFFQALQPTSKIEWAVYYFIAKGCHKVAEQNLDGAEKIELISLDFDKFVEMVLDEKFDDRDLRIKIMEAKLDPTKMEKIKQEFAVA